MLTYTQSLSLTFLLSLIILIEMKFPQHTIALPSNLSLFSPSQTGRQKALFATAGGIFGGNPYFCDSFALAELYYLPTLPATPHSASPLLSLKYFISNGDAYATSLGAGFRNYFSPIRCVCGSNIFCDMKHINCETFYQLGAGVECLSFLELRANVYIPLTKRFFIRSTYDYPGGYQVRGTKIVSSIGGWNVEIGKRFLYKTLCDLYLSLAPYFLFGEGQGIEYSGLFRWRSILLAGVHIYQNISCNTTDVAGVIGINIPLDSIGAKEKSSLKRIPISRWQTMRTSSRLKYKTNY